MRLTDRAIVFGLLCYSFSGVIVASPIHPSTEGESVSSTANDDNAPGLFHMIDTLKGGAGIQKMINLIDTFKVAIEGLKKYMAASPLMKQMVEEAEKRNPKLQLMMKMVNGGIPDLQDIYKLVTTKSNSITADINAVELSSPEWKRFSHLRASKNVLKTKQSAEELVYLLSGKKVDFKQSLLTRMSRSLFFVMPGDDVAHVDSLQFLYFFVDNWDLLVEIANQFGEGKTNYVDILQTFGQLDYSHFMKVMKFPTGFGQGKYGVGSKFSMTDPDVVQMMKDVRSGQNLNAKDPKAVDIAEAAVLDYVKRMFSLAGKALEWVQSEPSKPVNKSSSGGKSSN